MEDNNIPVAKAVEEPKNTQPGEVASGKATAALILGILAIACAGFLTGIPAIIVGSSELKAIREGTSSKKGESSAKVGYILGIIGTVLSCLALLFFAGVIALGISLGSSGFFQQMTNV